MIVLGTILTLGLFLFVGWIIATEMFQHRVWRRRVESGDVGIIAALVEEAMATWRRSRPPRDVPAHLWAGVQGAQLAAIDAESVTVTASAEGQFRTEGGQRVQVQSAVDEAEALAVRLVDMMLYDVPNLRLRRVRVDIYATFTGEQGTPVQEPILTTTAYRSEADAIDWEALRPREILDRFETIVGRTSSGAPAPIELPPIEGSPPSVLPGGEPEEHE